jgi:uncharacterized membrane protein HdeD (DUF308 family)
LSLARAAHKVERWWTLMLEGVINLTVAGAVLVWLALAVVPLVHLASAWALVTGGLMLAAAPRLSNTHGRWLLAFGGGVSAGWGALAGTSRPTRMATCGRRSCGWSPMRCCSASRF